MPSRRCLSLLPPGLALAVFVLAALPARAAFVNFESGQVRPLALSPSGARLFAVNTPDNRLEIFTVGPGGLTHAGAVSVGLEPVAVAAQGENEVWVVNHLSDSVSVVDVAATPPRVVRTLLVGDEPRDIVFAGAGGTRAFITTARRGQNVPPSVPPLLTTPSVPRALVWVFDAANPAGAPTIIELFGDTPRALAASPDGSRVYAAVFHSGNQTTTVNEGAVCNDASVNGMVPGPCTVFGVTMPGGMPLPETNIDGVKRPESGLIVKYDPGSSAWKDTLGRNWNNAVRFNLPDKDVFVIDANGSPPAQIPGPTGSFSSVGTVVFNMVVNPAAPSRIYVSNTEARNEVRFEGPGVFGGSTVRGHLHEARVTVLDGTTVVPRHLNKHLDYDVVPSPALDKANSLATPTGMAITSDGATLYVAAFGSSKVGILDTTALLADTFVPSDTDHVLVSGGGPSGLVLDEANDRLYVLTRFDNAISVIDTVSRTELAHLPVYNPEPPVVLAGRSFLYDAVFTSSNGEASCSTCHVFGDFDSLAWDLGNPDDSVLNNPNPFRVANLLGISFEDHHPMKGPMTTQSLRGMANHGPMHWRGDRTGGNDPGGDALDEVQAFEKFNVAFDGLLGRGGPIPAGDMTAFANFILTVTYPPNPIRALDNSLSPDEDTGRNFYFNSFPSDVFESCNGCHVLNSAAGFFGSDGFSSFEFEPQLFKIPHLRNAYQKVGMFGLPEIAFVNPGDNGHQGDQVRGFGFIHDGSIDTLFRFHNATVFNQTDPAGFPIPNPGGFPDGFAGDVLRRQVEAFVLAFDSNLAPIVGQQLTFTTADALTQDQLLVGKKITLIDNPGNDESRRRILVFTKDAPATPAPGSAGDPRCGSDPVGTVKARLRVGSRFAGQAHETPLPCQNWTLLGRATAPRGYRYRDQELDDGTASSLVWKTDRLLKAVLTGRGSSVLNYDLQGGPQGFIDVQLTSGPERLCFRCLDPTGSDTRVLTTGCNVPPACPDSPRGRLELFRERADVLPHECDLVVKAAVAGEARGWVYQPVPSGQMRSDRASEPLLTPAQLEAMALVAGQDLTYTCTPPGSGTRIGVDRDEDGFFDRDELDGGSDPADPGDTP
jgi:YVTN family beta-propeller protein